MDIAIAHRTLGLGGTWRLLARRDGLVELRLVLKAVSTLERGEDKV